MKKKINLVLHAHIPYVLHSDVAYWLYEVALHSYLPLLQLFSKYEDNDSPPQITLNLSPILLVQLSSPDFQQGFDEYLLLQKNLLSLDLNNEEKNSILKNDLDKLLILEEIYKIWDKNIISGFQYFHQKGLINIITSAVTHAFLPALVDFPNLLDLQIRLGKKISEYFFTNITGFWSPECGIFPELSRYLTYNNLTHTYADPSTICYQDNLPSFSYQGVSFIVRNYQGTDKIWCAQNGYPGNGAYREFHRDLVEECTVAQKLTEEYKIFKSGISLYAITDKKSPYKNLYNTHQSQDQLHYDVEDYINYIVCQLEDQDCFSVFFDLELFGHWWKEGIDFLDLLFQKIEVTDVQFSSPDISKEQPEILPKLSTWGTNQNAESWINPKTTALWQKLIPASMEMERAINLNQKIPKEKLYNFLLAQASDWPFLISHDTFEDYALAHVDKLLYGPVVDHKLFDKNLLYTIL